MATVNGSVAGPGRTLVGWAGF
jgi:hypothetical protein